MLGKTWPRGYREEVKKKKSLQTNRHTGGQKDDGQRLSRKAEIGELKKKIPYYQRTRARARTTCASCRIVWIFDWTGRGSAAISGEA